MTLRDIVKVCDVPCCDVHISAGGLNFRTVAHNYRGEIDALVDMFGDCEVTCIEVGDYNTLTLTLGEMNRDALLAIAGLNAQDKQGAVV